ncbi:MAG: hypothetical protein GYA21_07765 [Myxococcales bacterium]|nr:hypothetical protein [Myxococcales bacterium]
MPLTPEPLRRKKRLAAALAAVIHHQATLERAAGLGAAPSRWKRAGLLGLMQRPEPPAARRCRA